MPAVHGIKNAGRKGNYIMAVGAFDARQVPSGGRVNFADGTIYQIGHREPVKGHAFRSAWVGHELRRVSP